MNSLKRIAREPNVRPKRPAIMHAFRVLLCLLLLACGARAAEFKLAVPPYSYAFPRDHNSHPAYATEWWYYTGHLQSKGGRKFGYQLTWFRTALAPSIDRKSAWAARDVMFAHFALTDESGQKFYFTDRIGRANLGLNGADANSKTPRIWCGDWVLKFNGKTGETQTIRARGTSDARATNGQDFALNLNQIALKPPVVHGENGVSQKSQGRGRASHYYSFTRLKTSGTLVIGNERLSVTGQSWFDHEFGSNQMDASQVGWDWFSLQFTNGRELMVYRLRLKNGKTEPYSSGTWVEKSGKSRHLKLADYTLTPLSNWKSSASGATYPAKWRIRVPREKIDLIVTPTVANQELRPSRTGANLAYWEGSVVARGTDNGRLLSGVGYLEMTGYASAFGQSF